MKSNSEHNRASVWRSFGLNCGAYDPHSFAEMHKFGLFVARSAPEAKRQALDALLTSADQQHKDDLFEVDDCLAIDNADGYFVHLTPNVGEAGARSRLVRLLGNRD